MRRARERESSPGAVVNRARVSAVNAATRQAKRRTLIRPVKTVVLPAVTG